jgi:hypothetical protein
MKRLCISIGLIGCLIVSAASTAAAGSRLGVRTTSAYPHGCKTVAFTADGGYFSQGQFFWQTGYTVTLTTNWCYSGGTVTSYSVSYSTTIPESLDPRISTTESFARGRSVLDVQMNGSFNSGVINNVSFVTIDGDVTRRGHHHFSNESGAGG